MQGRTLTRLPYQDNKKPSQKPPQIHAAPILTTAPMQLDIAQLNGISRPHCKARKNMPSPSQALAQAKAQVQKTVRRPIQCGLPNQIRKQSAHTLNIQNRQQIWSKNWNICPFLTECAKPYTDPSSTYRHIRIKASKNRPSHSRAEAKTQIQS